MNGSELSRKRLNNKTAMITQLAVGGLDNNFSYFVNDGVGNEIAVVDPAGDIDDMLAEIYANKFQPIMVLLTHSHFDHAEGVEALIQKYKIPVYMHMNARGRVEVPEEHGRYVSDGDTIIVGKLAIEVLYTPGHIDDSVCYFISAKQEVDGIPKLITGDTLFVEGCGRADLQHSSVKDLYSSLERLKKMPDETLVYPGHNYGSKPVSDIAFEKKHNKYFLCKNFEEFKAKRMSRLT